MATNTLMNGMHSYYRKGHSIETAPFRVHNNIIAAVDASNSVILILLNLSATFSTVDNTIMLNFLKELADLDDCALNLFESRT